MPKSYEGRLEEVIDSEMCWKRRILREGTRIPVGDFGLAGLKRAFDKYFLMPSVS